MIRKKAFLNLSKANAAKVYDKAKTIIERLMNNANFAAPTPSIDELIAANELLNQLRAEYNSITLAAHEAFVKIDNQKDEVQNLLEALGSHITIVANGDEAKILSAGFQVRKENSPVGELLPPLSLLAEEGNGVGLLACSWQPVKGAKSYNVEVNLDINQASGWQHIQTVTKSKCVVKNLTSGTRVWFRVAAVGPVGQSPYSDVTTRIVP